jgi:hypothetical protein
MVAIEFNEFWNGDEELEDTVHETVVLRIFKTFVGAGGD